MKKKDGNGTHQAASAPPFEVPSLQNSMANLVYPSNENVDDLYDPFSRRPQTLQYSDFGAWAHMVKGGMGTGIMAMPMAFKYGGLALGLLGTPAAGLVCGHCVCLLVSTAQHLYVRARVPTMTMDQVALYAFKYGPPVAQPWANVARRFVQLALFLTYFFTVVSYTIFIKEAIKQLADQWAGYEVMHGSVYVALIGLAVVPLCQVRQLRTLVPCSVIANLCIVVGFAITLYYLVDVAPDMDRISLSPTLIGVPLFFSTALYSMEGIGTVMPVENTMRNPGRLGGWWGVASRAMFFVVLIFTTIGILGYLRFGSAVQGSVILNLSAELVPAQVVKALLAAAIIFTFPLQFYVLSELIGPMLEARVSTPRQRNWVQIGMRVSLVTLALLTAIAVPNLDLVIALMGAVLFSTLGLLIPAAAHLVSELGVAAETKGGGGSSTVRVLTIVKDAFLVALSLLVTCAGVYSALEEQQQRKTQ